MSNFNQWLSELTNGACEPQTVAKDILSTEWQGTDKSTALVRQHAAEVLHYTQQRDNAESAQWQQSFQYELSQSVKALVKVLKKHGRD